jgi:hypothetical protein
VVGPQGRVVRQRRGQPDRPPDTVLGASTILALAMDEGARRPPPPEPEAMRQLRAALQAPWLYLRIVRHANWARVCVVTDRASHPESWLVPAAWWDADPWANE